LKRKTSTRHLRRINILLLFFPFLIALIIMLPRLLSPQFGFEDDGISLSMAQKALMGSRIDFDDTNGFFRPFYWLGLIVEYLIGGLNPFWFYFTNLVVFWIIVAEIIALIRLKGGSIIQSSLSAIIFVLSSPIVESFYTNSKPEAQQLMWLAGSLLSGHFLANPKKEKRMAAAAATTLFILFASFNKSTFIALIPVSLGWVVLYWLFLKKDQDEKRRVVGYFISSLVATAAYFILRKWAMPIGILQGTYTNDYILNINFMIFMLNHWMVRLSSGYLGFLFSLVLMLAFWKKVGLATRKLALASLVWMIGWFVIYLPWGHALDYYLLPFAFGYAVFSGTMLGSLLGFFRELKTPAKIIAIALSSIFGLFVLMGLTNNSSNARIQLIMDRQDLHLLEFLSENAQPGEEITVNLGKNATFYTHVQLLMTIIGNRDDLKYFPFQFQNSQSESNKPYLLIMPVIKNSPLVKVRGYAEGQTLVNKSLEAFIFGLQPIFETGEKSHLLTFNPAILACPFVRHLPFHSIYCSKPASLLVDNRDFYFGWRVYKIDTHTRRLPIPAVYTVEGDLNLFDQDDLPAEYSFPSGEHPISTDWNADGFTDIVLFDPDELNWQVYLHPFDQKVSTFVVPGMIAGDIPLAGDWDCDGSATPGYFRPSDVSWHFWDGPDMDEVASSLIGAQTNDIPVVGDWDGDGCDTVGVYRPDKGEVNLENTLSADLSGIDFNTPKDSIPVPADWGGLGMDTLGFYDEGKWQLSYANCECPPANGFPVFEFGTPSDFPLVVERR
jgi:hypothetical protein